MGPSLAVHADWSVSAAKRWMSSAERVEAGRCGDGWRVSCRRVGAVEALLAGLRESAGAGGAVLGVDAPIGLPMAYAAQLGDGVADFPAFLAGLGAEAAWFRVCDALEEVSLARPFYPRGVAGGPRRRAHAARLGLDDPDALLRRCERKTPLRPRAAPLFWTLGANQVGKAALSLWREVLLPALALPSLSGWAPALLWPFAGRLHALLGPGALVVAETYPAEALRQLGLGFRGSKRRRADRAALAPALLAAMSALQAVPEPALARAIEDGFGDDDVGEDPFDSLIGLLGLLRVLADPARDIVPEDEPTLRWEGWILGQELV